MKDPNRNEKVYLFFSYDLSLHMTANAVHPSYSYAENGRIASSAGAVFAEMGYFVIPQRASLGLRAGIHVTSYFRTHSQPIVFTARYFMSESRNSFFLFAEAGLIRRVENFDILFHEDFHNGRIGALGFGRKLFYTNKLAALVSIGYNFYHVSFSKSSPAQSDFFLKTNGLDFKIGFFF